MGIEIGTVVNGYQIKRELGRGNFGVVYLARQVKDGQSVALKVLSPEYSNDSVFVKNFLYESKTIALIDHPNFVHVYDAGILPGGEAYLTMEYVDGKTLEDIRLNYSKKIDTPFLLDLGIMLASGLHCAWSGFHLTHRDIKPANLLITNTDDSLKISDLGLAGVVGSGGPGEIMATPLYVPPEFILHDDRDFGVRSDVYSVGIMFYELATGDAPFVGNVDEVLHAHLDENPVPVRQKAPTVDPVFAGLIERMISKDPYSRPGSWLEIRSELTKIKSRLSSSGNVRAKLRLRILRRCFSRYSFANRVFAIAFGVVIALAVLLLIALAVIICVG